MNSLRSVQTDRRKERKLHRRKYLLTKDTGREGIGEIKWPSVSLKNRSRASYGCSEAGLHHSSEVNFGKLVACGMSLDSIEGFL